MAERRTLVRQNFREKTQLATPRGDLPAALTDLSPQGFRAEFTGLVKTGDEVCVGPPDHRTVRARVVWSQPVPRASHQQAGLVFIDDPETLARSWVKAALQRAGFSDGPVKERRRHIRMRAGTRAALANKAGDVLADGLLLELSASGALLALSVEFKPGTPVRCQLTPVGGLHPLDLQAQVRSYRKREKHLHGLAFQTVDEPLTQKYVALLLKQFGKTVG